MAEATLSLQILPVVPEDELYPAVDRVIEFIAAQGLPYVVSPGETSIEGDLKRLLEIVENCHRLCYENGIARVFSSIKIDFKPDGVSINEKYSKYRP